MADPSRCSPYASPSATREVLERHGLYTKYGLGQNFLVNDDVVRKIVALAQLASADHVLEVGPGIGTLSAAILQHAGCCTAIEKDYALPAVLEDTLAPWADAFALIRKDALDVSADDIIYAGRSLKAGDDARLAVPNKMVSNLPYAVAATIVLDYLQRFDFLESATVMVQKEVADRMMASPGTKTYGAYTLKLSLYACVDGRFSVAPGNFFPPPHVESSVVHMRRRLACDQQGSPLGAETLRAACTLADAAFANRRKTLSNSCKAFFQGQGAKGAEALDRLPRCFDEAAVDPKRRGETLTLQELIALAQAYVA